MARERLWGSVAGIRSDFQRMFGGLSTVVMECGRPAGWLGDNPAFSRKNEAEYEGQFFTGDGSDGIQKRRFLPNRSRAKARAAMCHSVSARPPKRLEFRRGVRCFGADGLGLVVGGG